MSLRHPFIALTDKAWFDFLRSISKDGWIDEVNFWSPRSRRPMKHMRPGEPVFFRLKAPHHAVAGYGFFAHFAVLDLDEAWTMFGYKNGDPDRLRFLERIGGYRGVDLLDPMEPRDDLGCTILRDVRLWSRDRWIPWGTDQGWHPNIVQGRTEEDPRRASRLLAEIELDHLRPPEELSDAFEPVEVDARQIVLAHSVRREGQGTFRSRLLDAYGRRCAITGERTQPVLDAAHIQPYLGPRSNHIQNGLLLTQEFHTLFDLGLVTVTPDFRVHVSPHLRQRWKNGRRYYAFHDRPLSNFPAAPPSRPAQAALVWHNKNVYRS